MAIPKIKTDQDELAKVEHLKNIMSKYFSTHRSRERSFMLFHTRVRGESDYQKRLKKQALRIYDKLSLGRNLNVIK